MVIGLKILNAIKIVANDIFKAGKLIDETKFNN